MTDRLAAQFAFLEEVDRLKTVLRASPLTDNSRRENSAEHSWHIALFALVLADQAAPGVRLDRVLRMLLLHDIVEIDAGDVPIHAQVDRAAQDAKERAAAERIFGLLPADQAAEFRALWDEFEAGESTDAIHARSLDRVQPLVLNHAAGGGSWRDFDVTLDQLDARVGVKVARGLPEVWRFMRARIAPWFAAG
jgi:putative hydrolase of HD superfamily